MESDDSSLPPRPRKKRQAPVAHDLSLHFDNSGSVVQAPSRVKRGGMPIWGWLMVAFVILGIGATASWMVWDYQKKKAVETEVIQVEPAPLEKEFAYLPDDAMVIDGLDYSAGLKARAAWKSTEESFVWGIDPGWFQATGLPIEDASLKMQVESNNAKVYVMRFNKGLDRYKIINSIHGKEFKEGDKIYHEGEIRKLGPAPAVVEGPKNPKGLPVPAPNSAIFKIFVHLPRDDDSLIVITEDRPLMKKVLGGYTGKARFSEDLQSLARWSAGQGKMWQASVNEDPAKSGGLKGFAIAFSLHGASLDFAMRFAFANEVLATKGMAEIKNSITQPEEAIPWSENLSEKQKKAWVEVVRKGGPTREGSDIYLNVSTNSE